MSTKYFNIPKILSKDVNKQSCSVVASLAQWTRTARRHHYITKTLELILRTSQSNIELYSHFAERANTFWLLPVAFSIL